MPSRIQEMSTDTRASPTVMITPASLKAQLPVPDELKVAIKGWRTTIQNILSGTDRRLLMIVGPCSVHDLVAVTDYARKLSELSKQCPNIFFVLRTYFEKPRTRKGWSGFMHDPMLDGTNDMQRGIILSRKLMLDIATIGLPCATETLSLIAPQYMDDILCFACIGARTTESQPHRELASGLSVPVGFKNTTNGSVSIAIHSIHSAAEPKVFMGVNRDGRVSAVHTSGNPNCCLVLRGGDNPNYAMEDVEKVVESLDRESMAAGIVVDASHGNSGKNWERQIEVLAYLATTRHERVRGIMMESFIYSGNQSLSCRPLKYGVSVTDACIGWDASAKAIMKIHGHL
tara:strand:- start:4724 stop:5755 length:1032 start_codon:yes stop_codon:yes gene_type:complete